MDIPIIASQVPVYAHPGDAGADLVGAADRIAAITERTGRAAPDVIT